MRHFFAVLAAVTVCASWAYGENLGPGYKCQAKQSELEDDVPESYDIFLVNIEFPDGTHKPGTGRLILIGGEHFIDDHNALVAQGFAGLNAQSQWGEFRITIIPALRDPELVGNLNGKTLLGVCKFGEDVVK